MSTDALAEPPPKSLSEKLGAALPVGLTMVATAFAGLSTSEMTQAMYWRSAAAQDQSKATDQWGLAGFKRDRSLICQTAAAQLRTANGYRGMPTYPVWDVLGGTNPPTPGVGWLRGTGPPKVELPDIVDATIRELMEAVRDRKPEAELIQFARGIDRERLDRIIASAEARVSEIDREWESPLRDADRITADYVNSASTAMDEKREEASAIATAVQAARFELDNRRYRTEATLNQGLGFLYEVRVKSSNAQSDRHKVRSQNFFYAMLAAQVGATVASLGLARRQRSPLWAFAGFAGIVAVAFGVYVYLGM
jgi:hypothetical protein